MIGTRSGSAHAQNFVQMSEITDRKFFLSELNILKSSIRSKELPHQCNSFKKRTALSVVHQKRTGQKVQFFE